MERPKNDFPEKTHPDGLMPVHVVAIRLTASDSFVYQRINDGALRHYRLGDGQGGIRVSEEQLQEYLQSRERGGASMPPPVSDPKKPGGLFKHLDGDRLSEAWKDQ